jgi:pyrroloquinoline quinone biosynthesis protein D
MPRVFRNPKVMWREEDQLREQVYEGLEKGQDVENTGTSILYADNTIVTLNILGTEIWKRCNGITIDEIVSVLTGQFDVDPAVLQNDVMKFLSELQEKGLIYYEE